jgi:hypothetical protein
VDDGNSTAVALLADGTFIGTSIDASKYSGVSITLKTDQEGLHDSSLVVEWSTDDSNWDLIAGHHVQANIPLAITHELISKYLRVSYYNGSTGQTYFRLQTILLNHPSPPLDNREPFRGFGERNAIGITATGEDIWDGTATSIPVPPDVGEQMTVVSTDAADTAAGTGTRTLRIHYLDASGYTQSEDVTTNGTTGVNTTATNIRFVQEIHALTVGSNGVSEGIITIYQLGSPSTVYGHIALGGNASLSAYRMVPADKYGIIEAWTCSVSRKITNNQISLRLRSTDHDNQLLPGIFIFKDLVQIGTGNIPKVFPVPLRIPPLSKVKISAWGASSSGADVSASFEGHLIETYHPIF